MFNKPSIKCEVITVKNDYYCVNADNNNFINIPLYLSVKDSELVNESQINQVNFVNDLETEIVPCSIIEVNYLKEVNYDNKVYYQYDLKLEIDFIINNLTIYEDIYLKISYHNAEPLKLLIGNLCLYNYQLNEEIYYTSLKGLTKKYDNNEMLIGVLVKLETLNDVNIVDILSMNNVVEIDLEKTRIVTKLVENNNTFELVEDDYNIIGSGNKNNNIIVKSDDYLFIALKYKKYFSIPVQGFVLKYDDNGKIKEKVITPFMYYKTSTQHREIIELVYERN